MMKTMYDKRVITALWQEAFGDSEKEIAFFLENARYAECFAIEEEGKTVAMLFLVDCRLNGNEGKYIYAACTAKNQRGKGYMSRLLEDCMNREKLLCLIPGDDGLVKYYQDRGFCHKMPIDKLSFEESPEIVEYLLDGYQLTEPCVLSI